MIPLEDRFSRKLNELSAQEDELMQIVSEVTGLMEQKHSQLVELNVFQRYAQIHKQYAVLARTSAEMGEQIEALKRALFIQWYAPSEPSCFSGISELNRHVETDILQEVHAWIVQGKLDQELHWMLAWYYQISDFYFEYLERIDSSLHPLLHYLKSLKGGARYWFSQSDGIFEPPNRATFGGRGQMGKYWSALRGDFPE